MNKIEPLISPTIRFSQGLGLVGILIPIIICILSIGCLIFLWWVAYPFLLRYKISTTIPENLDNIVSNAKNGNNGANGKNSPSPRHGDHGKDGKDSPNGSHGLDGQKGSKGHSGFPGNDGKVGSHGSHGDDGIPGFNVIPVRENLFDTTVNKVYFVNGIPLSDHADSLIEKSTLLFNKEKQRILTRIQSTFKTESNKNYFTKVLNNLVENIVILKGEESPPPNNIGEIGNLYDSTITGLRFGPKTITGWPTFSFISENRLDTIKDFNNFLDHLLNVFETQRLYIASLKSNEVKNIEELNNSLTEIKILRDLDLNKVASNEYELNLRNTLLTPYYEDDKSSQRFKDIIIRLKTDVSNSFNTEITSLSTELSSEQRRYQLETNSVKIKNEISSNMKAIVDEINKLKITKSSIQLDKNNITNLILDKYKNGGDLGTINGLLFSSYFSKGAEGKRSDITASTKLINDNIASSQIIVDEFIKKYKDANFV